MKKTTYIVKRSVMFGERSYAPGQTVEVPEGKRMPDEFMPVVEGGKYYFCIQECSRHGRNFKPPELWDRQSFKELPPMNCFALVEDKPKYEKIMFGGNERRYILKKV